MYRFIYAVIRLLYYLPQKMTNDYKKEYELALNKIVKLEEKIKKLKEERDFFYKSAKQFREQVEKWEKDFVEWRIVEKD